MGKGRGRHVQAAADGAAGATDHAAGAEAPQYARCPTSQQQYVRAEQAVRGWRTREREKEDRVEGTQNRGVVWFCVREKAAVCVCVCEREREADICTYLCRLCSAVVSYCAERKEKAKERERISGQARNPALASRRRQRAQRRHTQHTQHTHTHMKEAEC